MNKLSCSVIRGKDFLAEQAWGALDIALIESVSIRLTLLVRHAFL